MKKTAKLTLLICLVLFTCVLMFTACNVGLEGIIEGPTSGTSASETKSHVHLFGEWTTTQAATCTKDGTRERYCTCGEKEFDTITASHAWQEATCLEAKMCTTCGLTEGTALGHTTATGTCSRCNEGIMPTITLPNTPISTSVKFSSSKTTMKITNITYEFYGDDIKFYYAGEKTYDNVSGYNGSYFCGFTYKLYDAEGYVVASGTKSVSDISVGDKFRNEYFKINNVPASSSYRLVIEDYK